MSLVAKALHFGKRLLVSPKQTLASVPALMESLRMRLSGDSTFRRKQDLIHASNCPSRMLDRALQLWHPRSVLDVGCGTGQVIDHFLKAGVQDVLGLEGSKLAIENANRPDLIRQVNLAKPVDLGRRFDLVYSVEVAEHIHPSAADEFVGTLARHGDRIIMTAARPGQGGLGHLNEQEPRYWEEKLSAAGFDPDPRAHADLKAVMDVYRENLMVFHRRATA